MLLRGRVESGRREAAGFVALPWVREQLQAQFGWDPFPGTLNLRLADAPSPALWAERSSRLTGHRLTPPPGSKFCAAVAIPAQTNGAAHTAIVLPGVGDYPEDVVELVAPENLRRRFGLNDGDPCRVHVAEQGAPGFRCVLFDLEGTLVDFQWQLEAAERELRAAVAALGFDRALFAGDNYAGIRRRALRMADTQALREAIDRKLGPIYDRYDLDALSRWSLRPGTRELLEDLQACAIRTGLVSNIGRRAVDGAVEKFQLTTVLGAVVTRNEAAHMKPQGDGIRQALEMLGAVGEPTLMVGDSLSDLGAARDAGVAIAIVAGGESAPADIAAAHPDHRLAQLADLAGLV